MPHRQRNSQVIKNAFQRLQSEKDQIIQNGLIMMMQVGLQYLLDAHDAFAMQGHHIHWHNMDERETLGWMVFHDGVEIASGAQNRGPIEGSVRDALLNMGTSTTGWVGLLMSDLLFDWYRVDYETNFLQYSADEIRNDFEGFFKPIK